MALSFAERVTAKRELESIAERQADFYGILMVLFEDFKRFRLAPLR
jgi:hypothetical protein